ncbi:MAG: sodium-dependent transporter [Synergistaceae bacterium]|jgi:NSS family neurotransmitter:Na+ symporter|nr:sodium-dependent transporter [Synergistaceae bacterium]
MQEKRERETLGSRLGFIFLSAGCAIGLGNVWRFPYIAGRFGGAAFVVLYLVFLVCLAMPVMVMEFSVGRASKRSIIDSFKILQPKGSRWSIFGYFGLAGNYILMMFYTTITGWMLAYTWHNLTGQLQGLTPEQVGAFFGGMLANPLGMTFWLFLAVSIGTVICVVGLQEGVERASKVMMCGLLSIMIVLAIRSVTLPGAEAGLRFYLMPDFGKLVEHGIWDSIYAALGQAFFTLSLGIGSMAIFGSYISRDRSLLGESVIITALDTFVALSAGLIIFPACFAYGVEPNSGPGLIFITLPNMFNNMPQGRLWSTFFFLFMSFAAMTTVVAVFEHLITSSMDVLGWNRKKASIVNFFVIFFLSLPCVFGFNIWSSFAPLGEGTIVLDLEDFLVSNNLLPLGSIVYLLFCCTRYGWGWDSFVAEANAGKGLKVSPVFRVYFTYVIPIAIGVIFLFGYIEKFWKELLW